MNSIIINFKTMEEVEHFTNLMNKHNNLYIDLTHGKYTVDGKSYLGTLALGLHKDITLTTSGNINELLEDLSNFTIRRMED